MVLSEILIYVFFISRSDRLSIFKNSNSLEASPPGEGWGVGGLCSAEVRLLLNTYI
jgi:hypothetical protein